uniref:PBS lyase n=1 Tax=Desulfobacca acetoxidans TaxID=60893 RepID=A0A7V4G6P8_9BACT
MLPSSRDRTMPPICPFCRQRIERPVELDGLWFEFDGGVCSCGAHYTLDPTARNGGAVMLQALVQACGGDWDLALTKAPGVDYEEGFLGRYNALTHRVGGKAFGTIYFIRLLSRPGEPEKVPAEPERPENT